LVETDLQLSAKFLFNPTLNFIAGDKYIHALRAVILNLHGTTVAILNSLTLFVGDFRYHRLI